MKKDFKFHNIEKFIYDKIEMLDLFLLNWLKAL